MRTTGARLRRLRGTDSYDEASDDFLSGYLS